jgi:HK97 family phage major capsid protein
MLKELDEVQSEMELIRNQLGDLQELPDPDGDEVLRTKALEERAARYKDLIARFKELEVKEGPLIERNKDLEAIRNYARDPGRVESGDGSRYLGGRAPNFNKKIDPFDGDPRDRSLSRSDLISRSMAAIDQEKRVYISDDNKGHLERLIYRAETDEDENFDGSYIAKRILLTENPVYRSAFRKYVRLGSMAAYNHDEQRAVAMFQDFELSRAAGEVTTTAGGFGVPVIIDPTIIITSGAADVPMLRVCRVEQVTNNVWKGVSSAGMSWSYDTEAGEVSDDAATLAQPTVSIHMARGYIPYSIEVGQDYPGFATEMGRLLDQGYADLRAAKTMTGTGTGEPWGIFTAIDQTSASEVTPTTDGSFGGVDVFKVWNSLKERYRSRAVWFMSVDVESAIRQFASAAGSSSSYFTVDLTQDGISRINGRPVIVTDYAPTFSGSVPGTTGPQNILVVGDPSNYVHAVRAGMSVEQVPLVVGSSQRPTGQRGMFAWARDGADSVNDAAFRLLQNQ